MMGTMLLTGVMMGLGVLPADVFPLKERNFNIPIRTDPAQRSNIKELVLYSSPDEGKTWQQVAVAAPDKDNFQFLAPKDGLYWFTLCVVDLKGNKDPVDVAKVAPSQKILVDTLQPTLKITSAERQGDDIVVSWEMQEDHPELSTLKLEYRLADNPTSAWYPAAVTPSARGNARVRPGSNGPVSLRLQAQDQAGNGAVATNEVAGSTTTTTFSLPAGEAPPPTPPSQGMGTGSSGWSIPPVPRATQEAPAPQSAAMAVSEPTPPMNNQAFQTIPTNTQGLGSRLVASSTSTGFARSFPTTQAAPSGGLPIAPLQLVRNRFVTFDYEVGQVGPSRLGKVELWVTQDDGRTWKKLAEDPDLKSPITAEVPAEGIYGFCLVVQSGAGLGRRPPAPNEPPMMRVEVDLTPPEAQLYAPEGDPSNSNSLVLSWNASDRNLSPNPITLEYADRRDGVWQPIATDVPNTGRFVWQQLPPNLLDRVYLRLIAKDTAGNRGVAETSQPVLVDIKEPVVVQFKVATSKSGVPEPR